MFTRLPTSLKFYFGFRYSTVCHTLFQNTNIFHNIRGERERFILQLCVSLACFRPHFLKVSQRTVLVLTWFQILFTVYCVCKAFYIQSNNCMYFSFLLFLCEYLCITELNYIMPIITELKQHSLKTFSLKPCPIGKGQLQGGQSVTRVFPSWPIKPTIYSQSLHRSLAPVGK